MEEKLKRMKIRQTLADESAALREKINQVEKQTADIFEKLKERNIVIPSKKDRKITQIEERIYSNEIRRHTITLKHEEKILKILKKFLKTPVIVLIVQGIKNTAHASAAAVTGFFTAIGNTFMNTVHSVRSFFVSIGNAIALPFRKIKHFFVKQREIAAEKRIARKIIREERAQRKKDAELARQMSEQQPIAERQPILEHQAASEQQTIPEQQPMPEQQPVPETYPPPHIAQLADATTASTIEFSKETPGKEKRQYFPFLAAIGVLFLLFIATVLYIIISNFSSWRRPSAMKPEESVTSTLASCLDLAESRDIDAEKTILEISQRLNEASYCCFENREIAIGKNIFEAWKARHLTFIRCVANNLPKGYVLAVIGHANRTGFEEDALFLNGTLPADHIVTGNYSYSFQRARMILKELEGIINTGLAVFYGVGSSQPVERTGVLPEGDMNRRITFRLMKKEESIKQKAEWEEKLKIIKKL